MSAEEFVEFLLAAMPSKETLEEYGLDPTEIVDIQRTFIATPKKNISSDNASRENSELETLLARYDCSNLEIGLVCFCKSFKAHRSGRRFAFCEADSLILTDDGAIIFAEHDSTATMPCAANANSFLNALAAFIEILKDRDLWKGRSKEAVAKCAAIAGGSQYRDFYKLLCG